MRIPPLARIAAFACLGIALGMAAAALRTPPPAIAGRMTEVRMPLQSDPLRARLAACRTAGEAAASDRDCLAAWEANRRRFLGERQARREEQ